MEPWRKRLLIPLICSFTALVAYLPALYADFAWEDFAGQSMNSAAFRTFGDAFRPPAALLEYNAAYYRPFSALVHMAERNANDAIFGAPRLNSSDATDPARARLPHAVLLLLHVTIAGLVAFLARCCLRGSPAAATGALVAGLSFALHPVHAENVMYISASSDSFSTLFLLGALLLSLRARERRSSAALILAGVFYFAALLCKELAIIGLVLLPLCFWMLPLDKERAEHRLFPSWVYFSTFGAGTAWYVFLRIWNTGTLASFHPPPDIRETATALIKAFSFYVAKILFPWPAAPYVQDLPGLAQSFVPNTAAVLLFSAAVYGFSRGKRLPLFCVIFFVAALAPSLSVAIAGSSSTLLAERYLYLPGVAFALALGGSAAILRATGRGTLLYGLGCPLVLLYLAGSLHAAQIWKSDIALWSYVTKQEEPSRHTIPWVNLAAAQLDLGLDAEAEQNFRRALSQKPNGLNESLELGWNGLGSVYFGRGQTALSGARWEKAMRLMEEAATYFSQAVALSPNDWWYRKNAALAKMERAIALRNQTGRADRSLFQSACGEFRLALALSNGNKEVDAYLIRCEELSTLAASENPTDGTQR